MLYDNLFDAGKEQLISQLSRSALAMFYGILADIVVFIHLLWIIFLIAGVYWGRKHLLIRMVHLAGLGFAVTIQVLGWYCPLTHLEVWLREHQNQEAYAGSFIAHYAEQLVYLTVPPHLIFILTMVLLAVTGWLYFKHFRERRLAQ